MKQKLTELKQELLFRMKESFLMARKKPMEEFDIKKLEKKVTSDLEESMGLFINQNK